MAHCRWRILALVGLALASGCAGTPGFERAAGMPKFKALPYKTPVQVADSADALPQPTLTLGTLKLTTSKDSRDPVAAEFKKQAAKYGCDAVVGIGSERQEKTTYKDVEALGDGGRKVKTQQAVITVTYEWKAQCVRTAAMGDTAPAATAGETREPAAPTPAPIPEPETKAETADSRAGKKLAAELLKRPAFVRAWRDKLEAAYVEPIDALDALAEVMVQVTGPTGLWRKTMRQEWFGCDHTPDSSQCRRLGEMEHEFRKADALHGEVSRVSRGASGQWLRHNDDRVQAYLDTYVPLEPSFSGIQATPLYERNLKDVVP